MPTKEGVNPEITADKAQMNELADESLARALELIRSIDSKEIPPKDRAKAAQQLMAIVAQVRPAAPAPINNNTNIMVAVLARQELADELRAARPAKLEIAAQRRLDRMTSKLDDARVRCGIIDAEYTENRDAQAIPTKSVGSDNISYVNQFEEIVVDSRGLPVEVIEPDEQPAGTAEPGKATIEGTRAPTLTDECTHAPVPACPPATPAVHASAPAAETHASEDLCDWD
jgi:hypothetical protein